MTPAHNLALALTGAAGVPITLWFVAKRLVTKHADRVADAIRAEIKTARQRRQYVDDHTSHAADVAA